MKGRKQINVKQANGLSCEAIDPYLKNLTFSIRLIHFNSTIFACVTYK